MNTHDETAEGSVTTSVSGFEELVLAEGESAVKVTIGSSDRWDRSHLRRLRQSADLPGLVPVIDSDFASDGKAFAVTPVINEPTLASLIPPIGPAWQDCAAITEAAARATHEAHLRGLFHGALSPDQIYVVGDDVAVGGIGLGLGGTPDADYHHWVAPEVLDGMDATERSDVYSLGKVLEASLGDSLEDVPRSVRRLIMWSGSDTPEARPPSALEFASILAEALGDDRKTYSPAFIPTAEANSLASTASSIVAAHTAGETDSGLGLGTAAAVGLGAAGAAAVASQLDDVVEADVDLDAVAETAVDDADLDIVDDVVDSGIDVVDNDVDVDVDEATSFEVVTDEYEGIPEDAIVTGEVDVDDDVDVDVAADAAATTVFESDELDVEPVSATAPFDSREYSEGISEAAAETSDEFEVPAAQTIELDRNYDDDDRGNRAGILVGAILALGLALIAFQLLRSGDTADDEVAETDESSESASPVTEPEPEDNGTADANDTDDEDPAAEEDAVVEETSEEDTETAAEEDDPVTTTTQPPSTTTTEPPVEVPEAVAQVPLSEGPVSANSAGLQIVHGIPGTNVDIYVDGEAILPAFSAGKIAGPIDLPTGSHVIDVYSAIEGAPAQASDRTDSPVTSKTVTTGSEAASLFAHLDADGVATLSSFADNLTATEPASGRLVVRHLAQAPGVTITVDGEAVANGSIENGELTSVALSAGEHMIAAVAADGSTITEAPVSIGDGEMASITLFGAAANNTLDAIVQRFTGLATAPASVPTGNSNLLGMEEDMTSLYIVGVTTLVMALAGGVVMTRRRRLL